MATMTFTEQGHIYRQDGEIVPSVTQVMTLAGLSDVSSVPIHIIERAGAIGTAVHQACEFLDQDDLDLGSLDSEIVGYVVGYQKFKEEHAFKPRLVEHRIIAEHRGLPYGMTVDRVGTCGDDDIEIVADIKTSSKPQAYWSIQTAAYAMGLGDLQDYGRIVVHVAKDGTYKVIRYADGADGGVWESALTLAHWRLANGAKLK